MKKQAIITGATSGIGKAYAYRLADMGYDLILTGRRKEVIEKVAKSIKRTYGVEVIVCLVDFSNSKQVSRFLNYIESVPQIDFLINNAGYGGEKAFTEDEVESQLAMLDVHNRVTVALTHTVAQKMKVERKGYIIQVSSLAGELLLPDSAMYCATKAFLTSFTQSLALELKPYAINVQVLCPGFVHTDFHSKLEIDPNQCKDKGIVKWMTPDDVVRCSLKQFQKEWAVVCVPGRWNKLGYQLIKILPKKPYYRVVSHLNPHFTKI